MSIIKEKTNKGIRAIAISTSQSIYPTDNIRRNILVGIIFIKDEIRKEARDGLNLIKSAGINTIMVTGDSKETATSIAKEVGIVSNNADVILSSNELSKINDEELKNNTKIKSSIKSSSRRQKRLVLLTKELGLVTGMTGDGVNDCIALKKPMYLLPWVVVPK